MKAPRRRYDARIHVCADTEADFLRAISYLVSQLKEDNPQSHYKKVHGTQTIGYTLELLIDENMTNAKYYQQLEAFMKNRITEK